MAFKIDLSCPQPKTIYQLEYIAKPFPKTKSGKNYQEDEPLISNKVWQYLQVNGKKMPSQVFTKATISLEEYKCFLKRFEKCKKDIYRLYFNDPEVDIATIEKTIRELELTVYQFSYSPNTYVSRDERRLLSKLPPANMKYYETVYGVYYNRMVELERGKLLIIQLVPEMDKSKFLHELNRYYLTGYTTYYAELCIPAIHQARNVQVKKPPVDRYTLRRV